MTKTIIFFSILIVLLYGNVSRSASSIIQPVNAVVQDISFELKFGRKPSKNDTEFTRISAHLQYVERLLRQKSSAHLNSNQKKSRKKLINLLNEYLQVGSFPKNYDFSTERRPCFIDKDGAICAVGYLIEKTAGREVAEEINRNYKYEYITDMSEKIVNDWIKSSGLTQEECAMIQPTYQPVAEEKAGLSVYGFSTIFMTGVNLGLNIVNGVQMNNRVYHKGVPVLGLITGAAQLTTGILTYEKPKFNAYYGYETTSKSTRNLSQFNMAFGGLTVILSTANLIVNRRVKDPKISFNAQSYMLQNHTQGFGMSIRRRF